MIKKEFDAIAKLYGELNARLYQRMQDDMNLYLGKSIKLSFWKQVLTFLRRIMKRR